MSVQLIHSQLEYSFIHRLKDLIQQETEIRALVAKRCYCETAYSINDTPTCGLDLDDVRKMIEAVAACETGKVAVALEAKATLHSSASGFYSDLTVSLYFHALAGYACSYGSFLEKEYITFVVQIAKMRPYQFQCLQAVHASIAIVDARTWMIAVLVENWEDLQVYTRLMQVHAIQRREAKIASNERRAKSKTERSNGISRA